MPHLQPIVQRLDESIRATIPGLHYAVKWKRPYYGLPERGWIIELAAYDVSVRFRDGKIVDLQGCSSRREAERFARQH